MIGDLSAIEDGAMLAAYGGSIRIGQLCSINPYAVIMGHGGLTVGDRVLIAAHVVVIPANHRFEGRGPIRHQPPECKGIAIEDDVWIGAHATVLDGVTVGEGSVVAAGAVVTKSVEPFTVVAGVPAKLIGRR